MDVPRQGAPISEWNGSWAWAKQSGRVQGWRSGRLVLVMTAVPEKGKGHREGQDRDTGSLCPRAEGVVLRASGPLDFQKAQHDSFLGHVTCPNTCNLHVIFRVGWEAFPAVVWGQ